MAYTGVPAMTRHTWQLAVAGSVILGVVAGIWMWYEPESFGRLELSHPQIVTRERLVNDRFLQDRWLKALLLPCPPEHCQAPTNIIGAESRSVQRDATATVFGGKTDPGVDPSQENRARAETGEPRINSLDELTNTLDYRDRVRTLQIENQLDDGHDLFGNTLIRLKFDITVLPGHNTRSIGNVRVSIQGPEQFDPYASQCTSWCSAKALWAKLIGNAFDERQICRKGVTTDCVHFGDLPAGERQLWVTRYEQWLHLTELRLNQAVQELKDGYYNNSFSRDDYRALMSFVDIRSQDSQFMKASVGSENCSAVQQEWTSALGNTSGQSPIEASLPSRTKSESQLSGGNKYQLDPDEHEHAQKCIEDLTKHILTDAMKSQSAEQRNKVLTDLFMRRMSGPDYFWILRRLHELSVHSGNGSEPECMLVIFRSSATTADAGQDDGTSRNCLEGILRSMTRSGNASTSPSGSELSVWSTLPQLIVRQSVAGKLSSADYAWLLTKMLVAYDLAGSGREPWEQLCPRDYFVSRSGVPLSEFDHSSRTACIDSLVDSIVDHNPSLAVGPTPAALVPTAVDTALNAYLAQRAFQLVFGTPLSTKTDWLSNIPQANPANIPAATNTFASTTPMLQRFFQLTTINVDPFFAAGGLQRQGLLSKARFESVFKVFQRSYTVAGIELPPGKSIPAGESELHVAYCIHSDFEIPQKGTALQAPTLLPENLSSMAVNEYPNLKLLSSYLNVSRNWTDHLSTSYGFEAPNPSNKDDDSDSDENLYHYAFTRAEFKPSEKPGCQNVRVARIALGLQLFVTQLRSHERLYAYSLTPQEEGDMLVERVGRNVTVKGAAGGAAGGATAKVEGQSNSTDDWTSIDRYPRVVSYSSPGKTGSILDPVEVGWMILPRDMAEDKSHPRQRPEKFAVSATLSVPAWWDRVHLEVASEWTHSPDEAHGVKAGRVQDYWVDIPNQWEAVEQGLLVADPSAPEPIESAQDQRELLAGTSGKLVILGRRLWRSTVVSIGQQTADQIEVLPDMKGIIASFDTVKFQGTSCKASLLPLQIWTSQGAVTLQREVTINPPANCGTPGLIGSAAGPLLSEEKPK